MKAILVFVFFISVSSCGTQQTSKVLEEKQLKEIELSEEQREKAIKALQVIFKDPKISKDHTDAYTRYLQYKSDTLALSKEMIEAEDDMDKLAIADEMNILHRDYRIADMDRSTRNAIETLTRTLFILQTHADTEERVKKNKKELHEEWLKKRKAIIKNIEKTDDDLQMYYIDSLNQLDQLYQFQFIGFLLNL